MNYVEYVMPASCFPRYRYTRKVRIDLAKRYNNLKSKIKCENAPEIGLADADIENVSIFLNKYLLNEEQLLIIRSYFLRNAECLTLGSYSLGTFFKSRRFNRNLFVVTSESDSVANIDLVPENFPAHIVVVVENETNTSDFSHSFYERKNIHVCLVEKVRQVISTHLERCALTGLKGACEFLEDLLNPDGSNNRNAEITKHCNKTIKEEENHVITTKDGVSNRKVKTRRSQSVQEKLNPYRETHLHRSQSTTDASRSKLNRARRLVELYKENKEIKETTERLIDEIVGTFNRSYLPKNEHPHLKISMQKSVNQKLLEKLQILSPRIRSYAYRFSTFQVYVDGDTVPDKLMTAIEETLKQHKITSYQIVPSDINLFTKISAGSKISVKAITEDKTINFNGTLGGFARTSSGESERLWTLMSRHVASRSTDRNVHIKDDKERIVAKVMTQINEGETKKQYLDIAAACVEKDFENSCDTRYITEEKVEVQGRLLEYNAEKLRGLSVHIRGASTPLGLGTITVQKRKSVQDNGLDENYIVVEDRDTDEKAKFCTNGDSGAIVCAESQDKFGEEVHLISMVVGENLSKKGSYTTLRLDKGLAELDTLTKKEFKLC